MTKKEIDTYLLHFAHTWLEYPFGEGAGVYKYGDETTKEGKIFAIVDENSHPLRVSLKCDPGLALHLREQYETVVPGYHLNKKHWNTIICSGQLSDDEVFDLARLSYDLVADKR